jgi:type VI secretion system protein ImpA
MLLSDFLTPVADGSPCGHDLDEASDIEYYNYVAPAREKLPRSYVTVTGSGEKGQSVLFDPSTIKADQEEQRIFHLLKRSRDARLVILLGQFRILTGDLIGFAEVLEYLAAALKLWWREIHPVVVDGDAEMREICFNALEERTQVLLPIAFARIALDRKVGVVSLRRYQTAKRSETIFPSEEPGDVMELEQAVLNPANNEEVVAARDAAKRGLKAIDDIRQTWSNETGGAQAPEFAKLAAVLTEMLQFLAPGAKESDGADQSGRAPVEPPREEKVGLLRAVRNVFGSEPAKPSGIKLSTHADARNLLARIEDYFRNTEPSSPAGLLVRQARLLVGRSLIEALDALAPSKVDMAAIIVDQNSGFKLDASRIRALCATEEPADGSHEVRGRPASNPSVAMETRAEVFEAIQAIEHFIAQTEPSSPVPMLLGQARAFMNMDFTAVMKELLKAPPS